MHLDEEMFMLKFGEKQNVQIPSYRNWNLNVNDDSHQRMTEPEENAQLASDNINICSTSFAKTGRTLSKKPIIS